jgi:hypothetical protein
VPKITHGFFIGRKAHPVYSLYKAMVSRCHNPKDPAFKYYGARGITVCDQWRHNPHQFINDMGERPPGFTLERINNDGPYSPENCEWRTREQQANNKRSNVWITFEGETLTISQWGRKLNFPDNLLGKRLLTLGWSIQKALQTPLPEAKIRQKRLITFNKETLTLSQWAQRIGIRPNTLDMRIRVYRWPLKRALQTPVRKLRPRKNPSES